MGQIVVRTLCAIFLIKTAFSQQTWPDDVTYEDLKNLGASCDPTDNCVNVTYGLDGSAERDYIDSYRKYCDCGIRCIKYDTCCVDSPYRRYNTKFYRGSEVLSCVGVEKYPSDHFFMVNECNPMWRGQPDIQSKCNKSDRRDLYTLMPAHDHKNDVTYKNAFCGICNGVEPESLTMWPMEITAITYRNYSEEELVESMTFNEEKGYWGRWENFEGSWGFISITFNVKIAEWLYPKRCIPGIIQNCDPAWNDQSVSQKCRSYWAPINARPNNSTLSNRYRNIHCAICNYAVIHEQYPCGEIFVPPGGGSYGVGGGSYGGGGRFPISFTLLFDVNPKDGVQVGTINKCKAGESYDPFFKKCRSLVCGIPGYVLDGSKCLRV